MLAENVRSWRLWKWVEGRTVSRNVKGVVDNEQTPDTGTVTENENTSSDWPSGAEFKWRPSGQALSQKADCIERTDKKEKK